MIYRPRQDIETEQDSVFTGYSELCSHFHREPWNVPEAFTLIGIVPDNVLIETSLAMYGASHVTWDFGHQNGLADLLIKTFGDKLVPYLHHRIEHPLHGGGTGMGEAYLEVSRQNCKRFCELILKKLTDRGEVIP